jgi:hypothetical protein
MPYIKEQDRLSIQQGHAPETPGELNYLLTEVVKQYWEPRGNYAAINDIIGALEGCKMEFYRRIAIPYEDGKIKENGDIYT